MNDFLIVGAGISGLTLAWSLHRRGASVKLLEAGPRAGGKICSYRQDGYLLDAGPNSLLDRGEGLRDLIDGLDLGARVVEANPQAQRRYVCRDGRVLALPASPMAFLRTPLFSLPAKLRLLTEPWRGSAAQDESVASFVRRRLGREFLDWAVDPFVSGVYAGDPERLSVRAATGRIHALEAEAGSLFLGALRRARQGRASGPVPRGRLISFHDGIGELTAALAAALGDAIATGRPVTALRRADRHWVAETAAGAECGSTLILATPAAMSAELLQPFDHGLADGLRAIEYPGVVSLGLGFAREQVQHALDGFGLLIPSREGRQTLGALFSSTLFPGRAPDGRVLLTAFIGGARNPAAASLDDASLIEAVVEDLRPLLGLTGGPVFSAVNRWASAIPQYTIGHLGRVAEIDRGFAALPDIHAVANWRGGIAVGDCINNALAMGERLLSETDGAAA